MTTDYVPVVSVRPMAEAELAKIDRDVHAVLDLVSAGKGIAIAGGRNAASHPDLLFRRFADMESPDRDNGSWGLLRSADGSWSIAPVYDPGSSLFAKRSDSLVAARSQDEASPEEDAFGANVSCYRVVGDDGMPRAIHPFDYLRRFLDPEVGAAKRRFLESAWVR